MVGAVADVFLLYTSNEITYFVCVPSVVDSLHNRNYIAENKNYFNFYSLKKHASILAYSFAIHKLYIHPEMFFGVYISPYKYTYIQL